jgi:hypothetical protein
MNVGQWSLVVIAFLYIKTSFFFYFIPNRVP